jgi:hypothetical protein
MTDDAIAPVAGLVEILAGPRSLRLDCQRLLRADRDLPAAEHAVGAEQEIAVAFSPARRERQPCDRHTEGSGQGGSDQAGRRGRLHEPAGDGATETVDAISAGERNDVLTARLSSVALGSPSTSGVSAASRSLTVERRSGGSRPTGKSSERSSWLLLDHKSDSAGTLAARHESRDRQAPSWPEVGTGVAPEFMPMRNSGSACPRGRMGEHAALSRLAAAVAQTRRGGDSLCRGHNAPGVSRSRCPNFGDLAPRNGG